MLLIIESFTTIWFCTNTITNTIAIMCSHMNIKITFPIKYPTIIKQHNNITYCIQEKYIDMSDYQSS